MSRGAAMGSAEFSYSATDASRLEQRGDGSRGKVRIHQDRERPSLGAAGMSSTAISAPTSATTRVRDVNLHEQRMVPYLAHNMARTTQVNTTFGRRTPGDLNEWEFVIWCGSVERVLTAGRDRDFYKCLFDGPHSRLYRVRGFSGGGKSWVREDLECGLVASSATHFWLGDLFGTLLSHKQRRRHCFGKDYSRTNAAYDAVARRLPSPPSQISIHYFWPDLKISTQRSHKFHIQYIIRERGPESWHTSPGRTHAFEIALSVHVVYQLQTTGTPWCKVPLMSAWKHARAPGLRSKCKLVHVRCVRGCVYGCGGPASACEYRQTSAVCAGGRRLCGGGGACGVVHTYVWVLVGAGVRGVGRKGGQARVPHSNAKDAICGARLCEGVGCCEEGACRRWCTRAGRSYTVSPWALWLSIGAAGKSAPCGGIASVFSARQLPTCFGLRHCPVRTAMGRAKKHERLAAHRGEADEAWLAALQAGGEQASGAHSRHAVPAPLEGNVLSCAWYALTSSMRITGLDRNARHGVWATRNADVEQRVEMARRAVENSDTRAHRLCSQPPFQSHTLQETNVSYKCTSSEQGAGLGVEDERAFHRCNAAQLLPLASNRHVAVGSKSGGRRGYAAGLPNATLCTRPRQRLNETVDQLDTLRKKHAELEVLFDTTTSRKLMIAKSDSNASNCSTSLTTTQRRRTPIPIPSPHAAPGGCPTRARDDLRSALMAEVRCGAHAAHYARQISSDSLTCVVRNLPPGLAEPVFDKLEALLAHAMLIPATQTTFRLLRARQEWVQNEMEAICAWQSRGVWERRHLVTALCTHTHAFGTGVRPFIRRGLGLGGGGGSGVARAGRQQAPAGLARSARGAGCGARRGGGGGGEHRHGRARQAATLSFAHAHGFEHDAPGLMAEEEFQRAFDTGNHIMDQFGGAAAHGLHSSSNSSGTRISRHSSQQHFILLPTPSMSPSTSSILRGTHSTAISSQCARVPSSRRAKLLTLPTSSRENIHLEFLFPWHPSDDKKRPSYNCSDVLGVLEMSFLRMPLVHRSRGIGAMPSKYFPQCKNEYS
ncbi:hypothetical protein GGX14DRAFT_405902 [Mycena pura]|uniref:Uncharacterized protein n=1 Tax=Mycena pura TaxID=153505 RepID=A0AAD6UV23_9AGAR|nr:hypothetical protein GGX14DRAFT_405902 [Mycena pura]